MSVEYFKLDAKEPEMLPHSAIVMSAELVRLPCNSKLPVNECLSSEVSPNLVEPDSKTTDELLNSVLIS